MQKTKSRGNGTGTVFRRAGDQRWTVSVVLGYDTVARPDGTLRTRCVRTTKTGFRTKKEALDAIPELRTRAGSRQAPPMTFSQIYDAWEDQHSENIGRSTLGGYRSAKKYFSDLFFVPMREIGVDDLQACLDACPCGRRTRENMRTLASLLFQYAVPRHQSDLNYAEYLRPGGEPGKTRAAFSADQTRRILDAAGKVPYADVIAILIYTGFRPAELFALRPDAYHAGPPDFLVGGSKTEAGRDRAVTIADKIRPLILSRLSAGAPWLIARPDGKQIPVDYFRNFCFFPALAALGIQPIPDADHPPQLVPYSCRHTFSNLLRDAAGSGKDKAALIGHETYATTEKFYQSADLANMAAITSQF